MTRFYGVDTSIASVLGGEVGRVSEGLNLVSARWTTRRDGAWRRCSPPWCWHSWRAARGFETLGDHDVAAQCREIAGQLATITF